MLEKKIKLFGNILNYSAWLGFLIIGFFSFFFIPWLQNYEYPVVFIVGLTLSVLSVFLAKKTSFLSEFQLKFLSSFKLLSLIIFGIALRVFWVHFVPPVQLSDAQDYVNTAQAILKTGYHLQTIEGYELKAYRPPGYTFFLALCMALMGADNSYIPFFSNILFYVMTCLVAYKIAMPIGGKKTATMSVLILTLWPSYVTMTGLALVEQLSLFLFTFGVWAYFQSQKDGNIWFAILAGISTGYGALVKPAVIMIPFLWLLFHVMTKEFRWHSLSRTAIAVLCMIIVIAPWSIRNYHALGEFVPISTNGGDNFYRANNPIATGDFSARGERNLNLYLYDEALWNKTGFAWGKEWIKENPLKFIKLIIKKQRTLLGVDSTGVYWALNRGHNDSGVLYSALYLISLIWWALIMLLAVVGVIKNRIFFSQNAYGGLLLWMALFFVVVHSVFESQPRYHMPMIGFLAIFAALALNGTPKHHPNC